MGIGSLILWIAIPLGVLWGISNVTESSTRHFFLSLLFVPAAMILFAPGLVWLNELYLRVVGVVPPDEAGEWRRGLRGPLRSVLYASMVIALITLFVWIFFYAENPPYTIW